MLHSLFKKENYSRAETIWGSTVLVQIHLLEVSKIHTLLIALWPLGVSQAVYILIQILSSIFSFGSIFCAVTFLEKETFKLGSSLLWKSFCLVSKINQTNLRVFWPVCIGRPPSSLSSVQLHRRTGFKTKQEQYCVLVVNFSDCALKGRDQGENCHEINCAKEKNHGRPIGWVIFYVNYLIICEIRQFELPF